MKKLNDLQRKEILLYYKLDNSKNNIERICNDYNITKRRLFQIVKEDKDLDIVNDSIKNNASDFTKRANKIINKVFDRLETQLETDEKITLSQLATTLGILYDKSRLENNLSTSNNSVNINIKVEH